MSIDKLQSKSYIFVQKKGHHTSTDTPLRRPCSGYSHHLQKLDNDRVYVESPWSVYPTADQWRRHITLPTRQAIQPRRKQPKLSFGTKTQDLGYLAPLWKHSRKVAAGNLQCRGQTRGHPASQIMVSSHSHASAVPTIKILQRKQRTRPCRIRHDRRRAGR